MNTIDLNQFEVWLVTGSQNLYGAEALRKVAANSAQVGRALAAAPAIPVKVLVKPVVKTPAEATALCQAANASPHCIGLITWCHTFSPSKMWINGLKSLRKPLLHLHTQHNRDIPWSSIDMDFMNLNQAAHGDREHGFIMSRLRLDRKVVVGYWQDPEVQRRIGAWCRAAAARAQAPSFSCTEASCQNPTTTLRFIRIRLMMNPCSRSPCAAWFRFMKSMSIEAHGMSRLCWV